MSYAKMHQKFLWHMHFSPVLISYLLLCSISNHAWLFKTSQSYNPFTTWFNDMCNSSFPTELNIRPLSFSFGSSGIPRTPWGVSPNLAKSSVLALEDAMSLILHERLLRPLLWCSGNHVVLESNPELAACNSCDLSSVLPLQSSVLYFNLLIKHLWI